ncbi:MAG: ATPase [Sphingobium sp.]|nr:ATPase [Sphingobium sp.]
MKRFYKLAEPLAGPDGWAITLDGRPVKTPARAALVVPGEALAEVIAAEWSAQGDTVHPGSMPMTGFANATIDRVLPALADFRAQIAAYSASDLFCYRAGEPPELAVLQARDWDPLLDWARGRYDVSFIVTDGIMPVDQPVATLARLSAVVDAIDPWLLAGAATLTQIGGTLVGMLAYLEGEIEAEALFDAATLDERWQAEQWGEDEEASARLAVRRDDFLAAARYCALAGQK